MVTRPNVVPSGPQGDSTEQPDFQTLSVKMTPETSQELRDLIHRKGTSATEIVRRAIAVYKFLSDQLDCLEHDGNCRHGSGRTLEILDPEQEEALQITIS